MSIKSGYSASHNIGEAVKEIKNQIGADNTKMIVFFASAEINPNLLALEFEKNFNDCVSFGCTTYEQVINGKKLKNSIVAMSFDDEIIDDVKVEVLNNSNIEESVNTAFRNFEEHYKTPTNNLNFQNYFGITLIDGLSMSEERIIDKIMDLTNVFFVGGSASDNLEFRETHVFCNGKAYPNTSILALVKPKAVFELLKTQSFKILNKKLLPTKVDKETRTVYEFNHIPAVKAYAQALNIEPYQLPDYFMSNPLGLIINNQPFVKSPRKVKGNALVFHCEVSEGVELSLLESDDIVGETQRMLNETDYQNTVKGILNFDCVLRSLELKNKGLTEEYAKIFSNVPTIGFSTYGEQYLSHINQTSTMILFK